MRVHSGSGKGDAVASLFFLVSTVIYYTVGQGKGGGNEKG